MIARYRSKYKAVKTTVDGITFDSKAEANYFCHLKMLLKGKVVTKFNTQVDFELQPAFRRNGKAVRAITYRADFVVEYADGHTEVVDVKGIATREYLLKRKLLLAKYPQLDFVEVRKGVEVHI